MRKIEFEVPAEVLGDFTEKLTETGLDNRILGRNGDDEFVIEVYYEKEDVGLIDDLEEHLDELKADLYNDGEEEEENEDK